MGEAKRRGTFEQRREAAMNKTIGTYVLSEEENIEMKMLFKLAFEEAGDKRQAIAMAQGMMAMKKLHPNRNPFDADMQFEIKARITMMMKILSKLSDEQIDRAFAGWIS